MIVIKATPETKLICPRHPREEYPPDEMFPEDCDACASIVGVIMALEQFESLKREAIKAIGRTPFRVAG